MFQNLDKRQRWASYGIAILVLFVLGVIGSSYMHRPQPFKIDSSPGPVTLRITGQVNSPGEYTFAPGTTVNDALEKADGTLPDADLTELDLSAPLVNGLTLFVPHTDNQMFEVTNYVKRIEKSGEPLPNSISINTATAEELDALPYIGPKKSAAIIEYRKRIGKFKSLEEIKGVKGIGDGIYAKIKPYIKL